MGSKDQRRIPSLEKSIPYIFYQEHEELDFTNSSGERMDGRPADDIKKMFMSVDVISQAKGSSYVEVGETKIVCGVYGPREVQRGTDFKMTCQVSCEVLFTPFSSKIRKPPQPNRSQKEISRQLKEALESVIITDKYPKAQIDVYISVIENGGSLLSTCLTAAGLALCHASIDVYDLVVGADLIWKENVAFVSPTIHEEECLKVKRLQGQIGDGALTLGMMPQFARSQIVLMIQEGDLLVDTLTAGVSLAINTCQRIYKLAKQTLLNHVEKALEEEKDCQ